MSNLLTINNVRGYIDENGTAQLNLDDISKGLGFIQIKNGQEYVRRDRVNGYIQDMGFPHLVGKEFIPENVFYRLAMKGETEAAQKFQSIVADEILPQIRKTGSYQSKPLSQLEILAQSAQILLAQEQAIKQISATQTKQAEELQGIRDVVSLNTTNWREDAKNLIAKMADKLGGFDHIQTVRKETYIQLNRRIGVDIDRRLLNKRQRMALEGVCKSKCAKINYLDIIAEDKKLLEAYLAIIKEMAIKAGVA